MDPTDPANKSALDDQIAKAFLAQHKYKKVINKDGFDKESVLILYG
jgi:hypothetical protein